MHIHLPKVPHSWREFFKEYAIIVLGVLTALGLEQMVESVHERHLAHEAEDAIRQELQENIDRAAYRLTQQDCIENRLDQIEGLLERWQGDDAFPAGIHVGFPGSVGLVYERWEANLASGRFNEESSADQSQQAGLYSLVKGYSMVSLSMTCYGLGAEAILRRDPTCAARLPQGVPPEQSNM
jgi:hypothetical protein